MSNLPGNNRMHWLTRVAALGVVAAATVAVYACSETEQTIAPQETTPQFVLPPGLTVYDLNDPTKWPMLNGTADALVPDLRAGFPGAIWRFPVPFKVGTGVIDPFLGVQAKGNATAEEGFNTDANPLPLDATRKEFTDALPLNNVPVINYKGTLYREVILDANEANSAPDAQFSIDRFDLYVCLDEAPYSINTVSTVSGFANNTDCVLIYKPFDPTNGPRGFATDGLSSGSGNSLDYDILIPETAFDKFSAQGKTVADCPYNPIAGPCGLWVILHTRMGGFGGDWVVGSTFEEYSTILQPFVIASKTAKPEFTREYKWKIEKSVDPTSVTLFDGQSQTVKYTVKVSPDGHTDSGWQVSGSVLIKNPSSDPAPITSVIDQLQPGNIPVVLNCPVTFPYSLAAGATIECSYTHVFASNPGTGEFKNTVSIELFGLAVTTAMSDAFKFTVPTTEKNKTVDVTDSWKGTLGNVDLSGKTFTYDRTLTCNADNGKKDNTATITQTGQQASASVNVYCLAIDVTKDAATAKKTTYKWKIAKTATPTTWQLFNGEDGTSDYKVTVSPDGSIDSELNISGKIHIKNTDPFSNGKPVLIGDIKDEIDVGPTSATVGNCSVGGTGISTPTNASMYSLAAGATIDCDYSVTPPSQTDGTNKATVTAKPTSTGTAKDFSGSASFSWALAKVVDVNKTVDVTDSYKGDLGSADWATAPKDFTYSRKFTCKADEGKHDNTATIKQTNQSASASVTVSCYELTAKKDASTSWRRDWQWTIDKTGDQTSLTLSASEKFIVQYSVEVNASSTDGGWEAHGNLSISNPAPMAATINSVKDVVSPAIDATVDCGGTTFPYTLAAGGTLSCTYKTNLPDGSARTNTATFVQQLHSYDSGGKASDKTTQDFTPTASVSFTLTPTTETDECIDVTDTYAGALGTVCGNQVPKKFTYSREIGPFGICGKYTVDNTSAFKTNDTGATGSDSWTVNVDVPCVGCTLTPGYWKTHNKTFHNGEAAPPDETWLKITPNAEQTGFFTTDGGNSYPTTGPNTPPLSWYTVMWTSKAGNAWYNLSFHYAAAKLNVLSNNGSTTPTAVLDAILMAEGLFKQYTPAQIELLSGSDPLRMQFIDTAGILAAYNEGNAGVPHCDEDFTAKLTS